MNRSIADIRKLRPQEELYIACTDMDFSWAQAEIEYVKREWKNGTHISDIADGLGRDVDEVGILVMDLARKRKIKPRKGGVFG